MNFLLKFAGDKAERPPRPGNRAIAFAWLGGCIAIGLVGWLTAHTQTVLVLGSFGATCVLVFGFPDVPFSQPRHVVGGHVLSSLIGLVFLELTGPCWWGMAFATGTAIATMMITRTVHPPAGSNPVIVFLTKPAWDFLFYPTLTGALIVVSVALIYNNLVRSQRYPKYW